MSIRKTKAALLKLTPDEHERIRELRVSTGTPFSRVVRAALPGIFPGSSEPTPMTREQRLKAALDKATAGGAR